MPAMRREDGFALPLTIFLVTLMTLMLAAIYVRVQADRQVAESSGDMVDALTIAQSGLQTYLGTLTGRPGDGDSTRINVSGGYADVVVHVVQQPADTTLHQAFIVRSTGHVIEPAMGATPQASRTVAQFAEWQVGTIDLIGAYTAANGTRKPGGAGGNGLVDIKGADQCIGGTAPATAGLRVPDDNPSSSWPNSGISGSPNVDENDNREAVAWQTGVDWAATIGGGFTPDYTSLQSGDLTYPSQLITGNLTVAVPTVGTGVLIVTDDLDVSSSALFQWRGVVLVGGRIKFGPSSEFYGAVISGLKVQLPGPPPQRTDLGATGTVVTIWHDSCEIASALAGLTGIIAVSNGWVDNWATY